MSLPNSADVQTGGSILFLGAGFSKLARGLDGKTVASAWELQTEMLNACGISDQDGYDLDTASQEYMTHFNEADLAALLHRNFQVSSVDEAQRIVVCQPWLRIFTTNYDNVIERCCIETRKPYVSVEVQDAVDAPLAGVTQIMHIYGSVARFSREEFAKKFILTEQQRDNSPFLRSGWFRRFSDDVLTCDALYFVGFSANDIDIRRLLGLLPKAQRKIHFIDSDQVSRPTRLRVQEFGNIYMIGVEGLARHFGHPRPSVPTFVTTTLPVNLEEVRYAPQLTAKISGIDIQLLAIAGLVDNSKFSQADLSARPGSYTVKRIDPAYSRAFQARNLRAVLVHSDIGNGKTVFMYQVGYMYAEKGFKVFRIRREPESIEFILRYIQSIRENTLLLFDDIMGFKRLCAAVIRLQNPYLRIVGSVRSSILESSRQIVSSRLAGESYTEVDLNVMSRVELDRFITYLDENGLFGSYADLNEAEKRQFLSKTCGSQMRDCMLALFETGVLHERVIDLASRVDDLSPEARRLTLFGALLAVAGFERFGQLHVVADLVDYSGSFEDLKRDYTERELTNIVRFDQSNIVFRSAALAEFVLRRTSVISDVMDVAKQALFKIDRNYHDDPEFVPLSRALLKFSLFNKVFRGSKVFQHADAFYDECRVLKIANQDPLFLVQRSICNMNEGRFDISEIFVATAYALARRRPNFDPYQIETHEAKLILTKSLSNGLSPMLVNEEKAQDLLDGVIRSRNDDLYHPLSVFRLYGDIVDGWRSKLDEADRDRLKNLIGRATRHVHDATRRPTRFVGLRGLESRLKRAGERLRASN